MVFFAVQKLLTLICFYFPSFRRQIQKTIAMIYIKGCSAHIIFKSFMVSTLKARSLIPFQFTFVYSVREYTDLISWELHV